MSRGTVAGAAFLLALLVSAPGPSGAQEAAVPAAGPVPTTIAYTGEAGPKLAFVGDSLAHLTPADPSAPSALPLLQQQLAPRYRYFLYAWPRSGLHDMRAFVAQQAATRPDIQVIELGSATLAGHGGAPLAGWANEMLESTRSVPCLLFVNLKEAGVSAIYDPNWEAEARRYNAFLRTQDAARPNMRVVDWNAAAVAHPEWFQDDGLHLNDAGVAGLAGLVRSAADGCLAAGADSSPPPPPAEPAAAGPTAVAATTAPTGPPAPAGPASVTLGPVRAAPGLAG